jgi:SAM-dependent methyltransferase
VGYFLRHLKNRYEPKEIWGFDMKDDDLQIAAHLCPEAQLHKASFENLPVSKFDVVFLMQVLEHVVSPEYVIRMALKSLRPGGRLIITIPDGRTDRLPAGEFYPQMNSYWGHINFWSIESWNIFINNTFKEHKQTSGILSAETQNLFCILQKTS